MKVVKDAVDIREHSRCEAEKLLETVLDTVRSEETGPFKLVLFYATPHTEPEGGKSYFDVTSKSSGCANVLETVGLIELGRALFTTG